MTQTNRTRGWRRILFGEATAKQWKHRRRAVGWFGGALQETVHPSALTDGGVNGKGQPVRQ